MVKNNENYTDIIVANKKDIRLDIFLQEHFDFLSRTKLKKIILDNKILINGKPQSPSFILKGNEKIECNFLVLRSWNPCSKTKI